MIIISGLLAAVGGLSFLIWAAIVVVTLLSRKSNDIPLACGGDAYNDIMPAGGKPRKAALLLLLTFMLCATALGAIYAGQS